MNRSAQALILYASTSGSTGLVVEAMLARLSVPSIAVNLKAFDDANAELPAGPFPLVIAGTPTYGEGDWHYHWQQHFVRVRPVLGSAAQILLFALGDARGHASTFGGGLGVLHRAVVSTNVRLSGWTAADDHGSPSPAAIGSRLPGLIVEYRRDRRGAIERVGRWLADAGLARTDSALQLAEREPLSSRLTNLG